MRLLIVEDDTNVARALSRLARSAGMDGVALASSVSDARQRVVNADAMILDLVLTNGTGLALLADMRHSGIKIPVSVLTGAGTVDSAIRALRLGAVDYLEKPATTEDMKRMLARLASRRPGATISEIQTALMDGICHRLDAVGTELLRARQ